MPTPIRKPEFAKSARSSRQPRETDSHFAHQVPTRSAGRATRAQRQPRDFSLGQSYLQTGIAAQQPHCEEMLAAALTPLRPLAVNAHSHRPARRDRPESALTQRESRRSRRQAADENTAKRRLPSMTMPVSQKTEEIQHAAHRITKSLQGVRRLQHSGSISFDTKTASDGEIDMQDSTGAKFTEVDQWELTFEEISSPFCSDP